MNTNTIKIYPLIHQVLRENINLTEEKNVGLLYHYTTIENLVHILDSNILVSGRPLTDKTISFTRNKNFHKSAGLQINGADISFVINGNKLSNTYSIKPYKDLAYEFEYIEKYNKLPENEFEEIVKTKDGRIHNIKNYILSIRIHIGEYTYKNRLTYLNDISQLRYQKLANYFADNNSDIPNTLNKYINYIKKHFPWIPKIEFIK